MTKVLPAYSKNRKLAEQPLPNDLVPALIKWLAGITGDRPLFPGLADKDAAKMVELDCQAAAIPLRTTEGKRSFHSLRNTFISTLAGVHRLPWCKSWPATLTYGRRRRTTGRRRTPNGLPFNGLPSLGGEAAKPRLHRPGEVA